MNADQVEILLQRLSEDHLGLIGGHPEGRLEAVGEAGLFEQLARARRIVGIALETWILKPESPGGKTPLATMPRPFITAISLGLLTA